MSDQSLTDEIIFTDISQRFKWEVLSQMLPHSLSLECMVWLHSGLSL